MSNGSGQARLFGTVGIIGLVLALGLTNGQTGIMIISAVLAVALVILVIYFQAINRRNTDL